LLHRRAAPVGQNGFTIVELAIVMVLVGLVSITAYSFFNTSLNQYIALQQNGTSFAELSAQSQRIANVVRGTTGIISAGDNDFEAYAYFAPDDTYVSQIHYYLNASSTSLMADVTPMTANPPIGTPLPAQKRTYTIIENFYTFGGVSLFTYLDASYGTIATPIADLNSIKAIKINLAVPSNAPTKNSNQQISLQISLRNRKTNL
jgi:prepilin-type N-terminal cleavage/methylation domain-containing protein